MVRNEFECEARTAYDFSRNSLAIRCLFDPIQDWWLIVISSRKAGQMAVETEQSLESIKLDWCTLVLFQFELNHLSFV